jgi:hypothetical protein
MISVGVRTPEGWVPAAAVVTGTGPCAERAPPFWVRPLRAVVAAVPPPPPRSAMGAFVSSQSTVKGNGLRIASSRTQRMADDVRGETRAERVGQYEVRSWW